MRFGFLIDNKEVRCGDFSIVPLDDFDYIVNSFYENTQVSNGWIYGSEIELYTSQEEKKKFKQPGPIIRDTFFQVPATHEIKTNMALRNI
ncbi:MAG: hypothetical protein HGB06_03875 [Chlorobaculum sp.]|jgi:hypothetical protein|nr:hypothetical protein [Chlorobaculum sp.]